jgi:hypothetical protein
MSRIFSCVRENKGWFTPIIVLRGTVMVMDLHVRAFSVVEVVYGRSPVVHLRENFV